VPEVRIEAITRTEFGKGAARRLRRDAKIPAVVYSHGGDPIHIALPHHELSLALKTPNVLLELDLPDGKQLALPKAIQRDPVRYSIEHVDLVSVKSGEKVTVEVPVQLDGKIAPGGLLEHVNDTLAVEAEATHLPESLSASIEGLQIGGSVHARDVVLPPGTILIADPDTVVVHVLAPPTVSEADLAAEGEAAGAVAEAGAPAPADDAAPADES
jgi:large subunit ribosomal protein L25